MGSLGNLMKPTLWNCMADRIEIQVTVEEALVRKMKRLCAHFNVTQNEVIENAIEDWLVKSGWET